MKDKLDEMRIEQVHNEKLPYQESQKQVTLLTDQLWVQIKKILSTKDHLGLRIVLNSLVECLKETIECSIRKEDFHIIINNINKFLINELINYESNG